MPGGTGRRLAGKETAMNRSRLGIALLAAVLAAPGCATQTLDRIRDTGTISLGYREASVPYSFLDASRRPTGYSVDLCARIASDIQRALKLSDLKLQWVPVTPETRIAAVVDGKIDIECGSTTNTLSRQEQVDFTHLTFIDGGSLLVRLDSGIRELADLAGKKIGIAPGTTTEAAFKEWVPRGITPPQIVPVKDHPDGLRALEDGQIDAYASDRVILIGMVANARERQRLAIVEDYFSYEPYALMVRRGDPAFRLAVNRSLSQLYRTGDVFRIYEKWFGALGRPSPLLRDLYLLQSLPE
jgi:ABC-type amino acid transport substrate-binding protein